VEEYKLKMNYFIKNCYGGLNLLFTSTHILYFRFCIRNRYPEFFKTLDIFP